MKKLAANATVWMAAPSNLTGGGQARSTTVNQEILRYITFFFGGGCILLLALAVIFAFRDETSWRSVGIVAGFVAVNAGLYAWALYSQSPFRALIVQTILGGILCPLAYLGTDGILALWWPGFAILSFSGAIAWGLQTSNPWWGRLILAYYLGNMALTSLLVSPQPHPYELFLRTGLIAFTGLMLIQLTEILSQSLSKVYERSIQHRKAKEEMAELTRLKTDFFANVSHEFRTPITLTLGPLEAALRGRYGEVGEELRNQLGIMTRNQQRLLALINQILDVSKLEAGAIELKAARIADFNRFVQDRLEGFRPTAEARKIQLKSSFDSLVPGMEIYIDREKFDKILLNLLSNSLKFTKQGYIEVTTEVQGDRLVTRVSDTGIGIKESELPHVFERFRQADGSTTREFAGTGLGLALVKEFAKLHGGDVSVRSRYGEGTTFEVVIPVGKSHLSPKSIVEFDEEESGAPAMPAAAAPQEPDTPSDCAALNLEAEQGRDPEQPTIVCAEDNPELRYFLRDLLMDAYNVYVGANGKEGLELAKKHHPDLILSDLMMPVMSGIDFCRKVREDPALRPIPFVLLTARSMASSKLEGLEGGADDYLTKPFSETELLARVKNLIALRQQQVKLERELQAARAIQLSLLPPAPQRFEGCELDFFYRPSEELSGDFCDILPKGEWLYFYIADVTSHGTASAQVTYLIKEIFSSLVEDGAAEMPLVEVVREAQRRYAARQLKYDVALQFARYHQGRRTLEVIRGNAPSPLHITAADGPHSLKIRPSPALSAEPPPPPEAYHAAEFQLAKGESVFFFTDGCYEFPFGGNPFGLKRLQPLLASAPANGEWKESVFRSLTLAHGEGPFPDDLTLLKLKAL